MAVDRSKVSFAEAEGKPKFPEVLQWGALDQRLRAALWNRFFWLFDEHVEEYDHSFDTFYVKPLHGILIREFVHRRHEFANEFRESYPSKKACLAVWANFFRESDYVEIFDFITFVLRDRDCPKELAVQIRVALDQPWSPYRLIEQPPTVIPAILPEQATTIKTDVTQVFSSRFEGARIHLQAALDAINKGDHRSVVRESINAVESSVRDFTGDEKAVLSRALKMLSDEKGLHPVLSTAFDKLYAYTSDEQGIRHALVFGENDKVGFDEAMFFVSSCSAFIAYLSRKA